ncbi:MAG: hypothetical protein J3R72DRAFT_494550 [Linnemannia gamsii]|nr:MAG: hypothetical protein J3R72DRAFT_494550 [Linnemannia gamsii]
MVLGGLAEQGLRSAQNPEVRLGNLLLSVSRVCKFLDSLSVSWEAHELNDNSMDQHIFKVSEMFESLEPFLAREQKHQQLVVLMSEQCRSLRSLSASLCELHAFQMDFFYRSCPNLRAVEFKAAQATPLVMEKNFASLAPQHPTQGRTRITRSELLEQHCRLSTSSMSEMSSVILDDITTVPGLSQLTIDGYIPDSPWTYSQFPELMASHPLLEGVHKAEKDHLFRLPRFASQETVSYLDILTLDMEDCRKLFKIVFRRI